MHTSATAPSWPRYPDLTGTVASVTGGSGLVTGGSRGIGAATCRAPAGNGVEVAVNGRDVTPRPDRRAGR
jgi:3-oxoacyl-[acyl-carrier protein] reductase